MEKERFLVEVTVKGEKDWKAIHMCGSMADAVPVADAVHNLSYLEDSSRFWAMIAVRSFWWTGAFSGGMPSISSALKTFQ